MHEMLSLVKLLASTLAATIAIELLLAAVLFGVRERRELAVVALAQVVTNPPIELLCVVLRWYPSLPLGSSAWVVLLAAELAAIIVEALLYRVASVTEHPWRTSLVLNLASFVVGLLLA